MLMERRRATRFALQLPSRLKQGDISSDGITGMTPDLILLDGGLIDPDSLELLHRVRAAPDLCNVPVVMFTGFRDTRTDCEKLWDQWVQKPMNWQSYSDTVTDILKLLPVV